MKTLPLLTAALLLSATASFAQTGHGTHFITNWDRDDDGIVTLAEATEKRGDIFTAFDADEDGKLSASEYNSFDEARAADQAGMQQDMAGMGQGNGTGQGNGQGNGQGKGKGKDKGHGQGGMGQGMMNGNPEEGGMMRAFNDTDGDGLVSRDEFMAKTPDWFAKMDRNGDGNVTVDDFGMNN